MAFTELPQKTMRAAMESGAEHMNLTLNQGFLDLNSNSRETLETAATELFSKLINSVNAYNEPVVEEDNIKEKTSSGKQVFGKHSAKVLGDRGELTESHTR